MKVEPSEAEALHHMLKLLKPEERELVMIATDTILKDTAHLPLKLQALAIGVAGSMLQRFHCN